MKDLRALLIDCRIELRKAVRDFEKTELCDRINAAIIEAAKASQAPAAAPAPATASAPAATPAEPPGKTQTANQVGLAWQTAARDLRFSHPHVYEALGQRVMNLLGQKAMVDPANEIEQLNKSVLVARKLKELADQQRGEAYAERDAVIKERDDLLGALAAAVPELDDSGDRLATAIARVQVLQQRQGTGGGGGSRSFGGNGAATPAAPSEGPIPGPEALAAIADGKRKFTKDQMEWALGEGMVLSGFRMTHVELLEQGEAALAKMILAAKKG